MFTLPSGVRGAPAVGWYSRWARLWPGPARRASDSCHSVTVVAQTTRQDALMSAILWSDQGVAPANSIDYYNSVPAKSSGAAIVQRSIGCSWSRP